MRRAKSSEKKGSNNITFDFPKWSHYENQFPLLRYDLSVWIGLNCWNHLNLMKFISL